MRELDRDPAPLLRFLGDRPRGRLGLYYERLWQYLLTTDPEIEMIGSNVPVRKGSHTVGEFDCLYRCLRSNECVHLELAVKFYLGAARQGRWYGPNARDRLDKKVDHLLSHQIQLSLTPAAQGVLSELGVTQCTPRIDLKGYLFAPAAGMPSPEGYSKKHSMQSWLPVSQFDIEKAPADCHWQLLPRARWLGPFRSEVSAAQGTDALATALRCLQGIKDRPLHVVACDRNGEEQARCFVTPDGWPDALLPLS